MGKARTKVEKASVFHKSLYNFLSENLRLDTKKDYHGDVCIKLSLKNPETDKWETINEEWLGVGGSEFGC